MKTQKTKKSFKKKALLSSLSMLMVATVAVGSATYAWFMQNPTANASGLKMKATASKGLVILTETHKASITGVEVTPADHFLPADYLNYDTTSQKSKTDAFVLTPASLDVSDSLKLVPTSYTTTAEKNTASKADDNAFVTTADMGYSGKPVYKELIYCALTGATSTTDVTTVGLRNLSITFNNNVSDLKNSLRVAIGYKTAAGTEKLLGTYALPDAANEAQTNDVLKGTIASTKKYGELTAENKAEVTFTKLTRDTENLNKYYVTPEDPTTNLGALGQTGNDAVYVYIYLDGEDEDCYTNRINANNIVESISIDLNVPTE